MKLLPFILLSLVLCGCVSAQTNGIMLMWRHPDYVMPLGYAVALGTSSGSFYDLRFTDQTNSCYKTSELKDGTNWFAVAAVDQSTTTNETGRNDFRISGWSNWVAVRRIRALNLDGTPPFESSTDLKNWLPWTNSGPILMTNDMRFFRGVGARIAVTNVLKF